jgi:hypothetical protein
VYLSCWSDLSHYWLSIFAGWLSFLWLRLFYSCWEIFLTVKDKYVKGGSRSYIRGRISPSFDCWDKLLVIGPIHPLLANFFGVNKSHHL